MRLSSVLVGALALIGKKVVSSPVDIFETPSDPALEEYYEKTLTTTCKTFQVRQEWSSLSRSQRKSYIKAVQCLMDSPSKIPKGVVPGAISRFDDFVATHINKTTQIHLSGLFNSWHRQFVWLYEKALQDECGYEGAQPYWDWSLYLGTPYNLTNSPLFNDGPYSLSGNGAWNASVEPITVGGGAVLPRGTGGGCVTGGPFVNHTLHLGPFPFSDVFAGVAPTNWEAYNPRCFDRDLALIIAKTYNNATDIAIVMATPDVASFQGNMSGADIHAGVHGGGHYILGGAGLDFFASPADPAFWVHHGMIDKMWTEWQAIEPTTRNWALNGTNQIFNPPGSTTITLDYVEDWGYLSAARPAAELMRVGYEGFCYKYE